MQYSPSVMLQEEAMNSVVDTLLVPHCTVTSNNDSPLSAATSPPLHHADQSAADNNSPTYGLRRRSRLGQLNCGQVFDCSSLRVTDQQQQQQQQPSMTLTPTSKDSANEWEHPTTSSPVQHGSLCNRTTAESDADSLLSFQAGTRTGYQSAFHPREASKTDKGGAKKRSSRRSIGSMPSPSKIRQAPIQPYHNKFSEDISKDLYSWLNAHLEFPYPTDEQKAELCKRTGLSKLQLRYWFTNVRRRTLPSLIQSCNEDRQRKGMTVIKSRSRWESDPRQPPSKDGGGIHNGNRHVRMPDIPQVYGGTLDSGTAATSEKYNGLWSYSVQPMPASSTSTAATSTANTGDKLSHPNTPMAYCQLPPSQPLWHTASVAVAHVRNAVYPGMAYDGLTAAATPGYNSAQSHPPQTSQAVPSNGSTSHLAPIVFTPASPHAQLSFQAHASALYSPMEIVPTAAVQSMGYPAAYTSQSPMAQPSNGYTNSMPPAL
ncbi:Iroquois homeobox protein 5a-like isoform X2 [Sycon ciliatum]|uniref:Iroquois homeobox protein 5a-like isoform X2 n=1 Tax=Sycon ciliatum TaxID=27933 RepID=UPI0031F64446